MTVETRVLHASQNTGAADATGRCSVRLGPLRAWERWHVTMVSINNTSSVKEPEFRLYQGSISPSNLVGGTYAGRRSADTDANYWLETGESLFGEWTLGDSGSVGTLTVRGEVLNGVS